ncbi:MAG: diguanylate cyclase, partial [Pseudomonadales bacterium]
MKSHPDAGPRSAAEVVTQLPVPSRLGMLRFERLNEPSWALLFLDPACERKLGISAADLCALIDAPYASLMEPEARYRLHDSIQQQLLQGQHYLVRYTLHTPQGALNLLEMGEPFRQHNRQLLRGYLLIADESLAAHTPDESELLAQNQNLRNALQQYQRTQRDHLQHLARSHTQQQLIVRLSRQRYVSSDPQQEAAELITQAACEVYGVARAGIWHLNSQSLDCISLYRRDLDRHEQLPPIDARSFPHYLDALHSGRAIDAHDAQHDLRTRELKPTYLEPLGISSMLDASIRIEGEVVGILCLEHIGAKRIWQADEIAFAGELADQFAQVLINQEKRSATNALHLFQRAVEQSASAFLLVDRDGRVEYVNPSFTAITLYSSDEVCGHRLSELPALSNLSDLLFDADSSLAEHSSWQGEFRSRRKSQEPYWGHLSISKVYGDDGELTHYIGIYEDITDAKLAQQRIERLAYTDNLTNLGNRPAFIRSLEERFARHARRPMGLLLVDIDNFKRINDSLGHQTGDKLLSALARRLRNSLGTQGTLARFASNEFAILLDGSDQDGGMRIAQQVLQTLDKPLFVDNQLISITGSVGLAIAPEHGDDPQTLMKHAGLALHKAKANGKHQVQLFTEALNAEANYKLFVENNLRRALTQNELEVFYQPKLCLKSG